MRYVLQDEGVVISRSRTVEPLFPDLVIDCTLDKDFGRYSGLKKVCFKKQVRAIASSASRRVGILKKTMSVFRDADVVAKCFWAFILPVLEYSSPVFHVCCHFHLLLLDHIVGQLSGGSVRCDLWHRLKVASLCVFFKIDSLVDHPVHVFFFLHSMC